MVKSNCSGIKTLGLTVINIHHIGQEQEFTFLIIHMCVQQTVIGPATTVLIPGQIPAFQKLVI